MNLRTIYAAGWVIYLAMYALSLLTSGGVRTTHALVMAFHNVWPAALLGGLVLRRAGRTPWPPPRRARFLAVHAIGAAAYAAGCVVLTNLALRVTLPGVFEGMALAGIVTWQVLVSLMIYILLAGAAHTNTSMRHLREQEQRAARAETLQAKAELEALRAQLNPHFLFNTLHTLLVLVRSSPARAEDALERFGALLRYALRVERATADVVLLEDEMRFVEDYLALERLRMGQRLRVETRVDPAVLGERVPAFSVQPLVENSIRHGLRQRPDGGTIRIEAGTTNGRVVVRVHDNGVPAASTSARRGDIASGDAPDADTGGRGLRLIRQRLEILYGDRARLVCGPLADGGFEAIVEVPRGNHG